MIVTRCILRPAARFNSNLVVSLRLEELNPVQQKNRAMMRQLRLAEASSPGGEEPFGLEILIELGDARL